MKTFSISISILFDLPHRHLNRLVSLSASRQNPCSSPAPSRQTAGGAPKKACGARRQPSDYSQPPRLIAIDCEMCATDKEDKALVKVTAVDSKGKVRAADPAVA